MAGRHLTMKKVSVKGKFEGWEPFWSRKCSFYFDLLSTPEYLREREFKGKKDFFTVFKNPHFFRKQTGFVSHDVDMVVKWSLF